MFRTKYTETYKRKISNLQTEMSELVNDMQNISKKWNTFTNKFDTTQIMLTKQAKDTFKLFDSKYIDAFEQFSEMYKSYNYESDDDELKQKIKTLIQNHYHQKP